MPKICMRFLIFFLYFSIQANGDPLDDAYAFYLKGDFSNAIQRYRAILQLDPKSEKAHVGLIASLRKADDIQEAYKSAENAIVLLPQSASLQAAVGDVLFRMARIPDARKAYTQALALEPHNARAYWGLGNIHAFDFNRKTSRGLKQKAHEYDPEDLDIFYDYIQSLTAAEQIPLLEKYLSMATYETAEKRIAIEDQIEYLRKSENLKTSQLKDPPPEATVALHPILPNPNKPASGYRIKALINDEKTIDLHPDTGAGGILISRRLAEKLKLEFISSRHTKGLGDSGLRKGYLTQARSVKIGQLEFTDMLLKVVDKGLPPDTDGIIGPSLFARYLITLNFPQNRMELRPLPMINGKPFSDPDTWKDLDRTKCPEIESFSPMGARGHLLIPAIVNNRKSGYFILDTGAAVHLLSREFASEVIGMRDSPVAVKGISGAAKTHMATEEISLRIGRLVQTQSSMLIVSLKDMSRSQGFEISGLIGHPMLGKLAITLDYRDGYIDFKHPK